MKKIYENVGYALSLSISTISMIDDVDLKAEFRGWEGFYNFCRPHSQLNRKKL